MLRNLLSIIFILLLLLTNIKAQDVWKVYNNTNTPLIGPVDNTVYDIVEDTSGLIWCATFDGLCIYDGDKWENNYYLSGVQLQSYQSIVIDGENTKWLINSNAYGVFARIKNDQYEILYEGIHIYDMTFDSIGNIWFAALEGLFEYSEGEWINHTDELESLLTDYNLTSIVYDMYGKLWIGTNNNGVLCRTDTSWEVFTTTDGLPSNHITDLALNSNNELWISTYNGVSKYNGDDFIKYSFDDGLCSNEIGRIDIDKNDIVWFSTFGSGISYYSNSEFHTLNENNVLNNNYVNCVYTDKNNNVWVSYYGYGIDLIKDDTTINFSSNGINHIQSIIQDNIGRIWMSTFDGGINIYDGEEWINHNISNGFIDNSTYSNSLTIDNNNNIWIATAKGLAKYENNNFIYIISDSLPGKYNITTCFDKHNNLWVGTSNNGAAKFDGHQWMNFNSSNSPLNPRVDVICEDDNGNMWFGTSDTIGYFNGYTCKFDGSEWTKYQPAGGDVTSILNDTQGNMWFGLRAGFYKDTTVLRYDGENWETFVLDIEYEYENYTNINTIAEDKEGNILFGRKTGVSFYKNGEWEHKNVEDGYPANINAILADKLGNYWYGSGFFGLYKHEFFNHINNTKKKNNCNVYPNPVNDNLYIRNEYANNKETQIEIFDISGKLLHSNSYKNNYTHNIRNYPKGIYILKLTQNEFVYTNRFVKE